MKGLTRSTVPVDVVVPPRFTIPGFGCGNRPPLLLYSLFPPNLTKIGLVAVRNAYSDKSESDFDQRQKHLLTLVFPSVTESEFNNVEFNPNIDVLKLQINRYCMGTLSGKFDSFIGFLSSKGYLSAPNPRH